MKRIRIGHGYDVHSLSDGLPLILGGVEIPHTKGCVAHSDGDVVIHAMCDAVLGALSLGDIGKHFPDTSTEYKGIDSKILLAKCMELINQKGYAVSNIDVTIVLEKPKLREHIDSMRECLSKVMGIDIDDVSIKATTSERLGFVGREEGVEVHCVTLLQSIV